MIHIDSTIVLTTLIATLISSTIATIIALKINRDNNIKDLVSKLDEVVKITIQYPYLKSRTFISQWNNFKDSDDEKYLRYANYCTLALNLMELVCKHFKYNKVKIEGFVNIKDWIRENKDYWKNPPRTTEHSDSYPDKFKDYLNSYL